MVRRVEIPQPNGSKRKLGIPPVMDRVIQQGIALDKELEKRGLRFVRYADDCVIAVRSEAGAKRVMYGVKDWIERKLGLKINAEKTRITRPERLKYLGFGFYKDSKAKEWKCRPHKDSVEKFRRTLKKLTNQVSP